MLKHLTGLSRSFLRQVWMISHQILRHWYLWWCSSQTNPGTCSLFFFNIHSCSWISHSKDKYFLLWLGNQTTWNEMKWICFFLGGGHEIKQGSIFHMKLKISTCSKKEKEEANLCFPSPFIHLNFLTRLLFSIKVPSFL